MSLTFLYSEVSSETFFHTSEQFHFLSPFERPEDIGKEAEIENEEETQ